ncbi:MAG TPA: hypothetical protein VJA82_08485 [Sediminibacterium sp.]|uniref:hypothetical protein n=1 Tax=Sediminibacterium sp. TaxID=1917865 RepID=UPI002B4B6C6D|nr:hypothetical protein [Sediminibacterium sp.]HLD53327.1 hypothetical protein [Sediminibacterium sp.]
MPNEYPIIYPRVKSPDFEIRSPSFGTKKMNAKATIAEVMIGIIVSGNFFIF